ncbi:delta-aminolevulinic acid dehydratase [Cephaloticoccus primus]|uniref:Delta-aminolevulinic acid dehydratase n=1 Tax=Cephaloticoccus primus TaxID=1548207 RepID=A0A139STX6_9BACT|nr:porphobilinogen synthase [Cephaloticoccus primus]KXU37932.1 delta-aminolevulinic acid dehydratase [Cephaloticoccus primus]
MPTRPDSARRPALSLPRRLRRLRRTASLRALVEETVLRPADLIAPLFVIEGEGPAEEIASMPGQRRLPLADLVAECRELWALGIPAVDLFAKVPEEAKDAVGSAALGADSLIARAVRAVKAAVPELTVITDIALDPYTTHGHDGLLTADGCDVDNDRTVEQLIAMALAHARAGADMVAPSDMMDGRIGAIRAALDAEGFMQVGLLAYSAKFASGFYGPFREAVGSGKVGTVAGPADKKSYQLNPANRREAIEEALLDEAEGADILMVKPAGLYLDIIRDLRERTRLPLAAYQISGEYAQIHAAARLGWIDYATCRDESLLAIKRAGADMILTYFAKEVATAARVSDRWGLLATAGA